MEVEITIFNISPHQSTTLHACCGACPSLWGPVPSSSLVPSLPNQSPMWTAASMSLRKCGRCGFDQAPNCFPWVLGKKSNLFPGLATSPPGAAPTLPFLSQSVSATRASWSSLAQSGTSTHYDMWLAPSHPSGLSSNVTPQKKWGLAPHLKNMTSPRPIALF